jgi:hypothetical protein
MRYPLTSVASAEALENRPGPELHHVTDPALTHRAVTRGQSPARNKILISPLKHGMGGDSTTDIAPYQHAVGTSRFRWRYRRHLQVQF